MADELEALVQKLLKRVETLEAELVLAQEQLAAAKREIARKDQIIAALQQRLFGSKSERYHPDQEELDFGEDVLGKFEPSSSNQGNGEDTAGGKRAGSPERRSKRDLLPRCRACPARWPIPGCWRWSSPTNTSTTIPNTASRRASCIASERRSAGRRSTCGPTPRPTTSNRCVR